MGDSASDSGSSRTIKEEDIGIDIRPLPSKDGILIKVQPQQEPKTSNRAPIDLVLAVSVSKSMQTEAPAPVDEKQVAERFGLTVLDLVKHACLTILKTLEEGDRLAIVIVAGTAQVLQPLTAQHKRAKGLSGIFLEGLRLLANMLGPTNMWDGVQKGLELLQTGQDETYRVPALMLLTDGMDDYMPQEGWLPKLKSMGPPLAPIHTFGFGYNVKSGPLKSISEFSGGRYTYIPDSDMIATVLIHSMANIQSTTATEARLTIKGNHLKLLSPFGSAVRLDETSQSSSDPNNSSVYRIDIPLGSIQFGQSRDIYLAYERPPPEDCIIEAELTFRNLSGNYRQVGIKHRAVDFADLSPAEVAYHISRAQICRFLSSLFPIRASTGDLFHGLHSAEHTFPLLKADIDARLFPDDPDCASLMADLESAPPHGQISLALRHEHQFRWGGHYLLSLLDAHANQVCNSYKDAGPQRYGRNSPFFKRCRDALEAAFDDVEAPRPSIDVHETFAPPAP
ncbi:hypothetical protein MCOR25_000842 [Pyricularia grisea]|nr:hypothetical protein MCOR25_000842 [Pyricularia grisea]